MSLTSEQQPLKAGSKRGRNKYSINHGGITTKELRSLLFQHSG